MSLATSRTTNPSTPMSRLAVRLQGRLQELGLNFQAWDSLCRPLSTPQAGNRLCQDLLCATAGCTEAMGEAACRALAQKVAVKAPGPCGACVLAAPVIRRRRVLGAVTACFPTRESLSDGTLRRHGRRAGADARKMSEAAAEAVRHGQDEGGDLLKLLGWMIESEQDADIARAENETLSHNLANTYEELSLLYLISGSMKVNQTPAVFFRTICQNLVEVMHIAGASAIVYAHGPSGGEDLVVQAGSAGLEDDQLRTLAAEHIAPRFAHHRAAVDNEFCADGGSGPTPVAKLIAAPMVVDDVLLGMLVGVNKTSGDFDSIDLKLISSLANQAAVFVSNNRLFAEVQDLLMGVLHALTASIDAKDPYTSGHSARVAFISRRLAQRMGLAPARVEQVYLTGLLHDIGKIGVPESVLSKPGRLTEEEFGAIRQHPAIGARILGSIRQLDHVVSGISTHHERFDGKGYPQGLAGGEIPQDGQIVGLADAFDAMTSERTYRGALPLAKALEELRRASGAQFAPAVVEAFFALDIARLVEELRQPASTVFPAAAGEGDAPAGAGGSASAGAEASSQGRAAGRPAAEAGEAPSDPQEARS
jgi:putative nucleotidyltransferase with HDIG domain